MIIMDIRKEDLEEIDNIINSFTSVYKDKTTSVAAIAFCLKTLINGYEGLKIYFEE